MNENKKVYCVMYSDGYDDFGLVAVYSNKTEAQKHVDNKNKDCSFNCYYLETKDFEDKFLSDRERLERDLIRYGEIVSDTEIENEDGFHRIRIIKYDNGVYFHKMFNGEVIEVKKIC